MKPIKLSPLHSNNTYASAGALGELLNALKVFVPPQQVIHVGLSQTSQASAWVSWPINEAWLIDADPNALDRFASGLHVDTIRHLHQGIVADRSGAVNFYVASNPSENGLVDPNQLRMVWSSLALSHRQSQDAVTVDHLIQQTYPNDAQHKLNALWLMIDCFPGCRILDGASLAVEQASLVCVRVLAEPGFRGEPSGADLGAVSSWMTQRGFAQVAFVPGINPKVGHAVYARPKERERIEFDLIQSQLTLKDDTIQAQSEELDRLRQSLTRQQAESASKIPQHVHDAEQSRLKQDLEQVHRDLDLTKAQCLELVERHDKEKAELLVVTQSVQEQLAQHKELLAQKQADCLELSTKLDQNAVNQAEVDALKTALQAERQKNEELQADNQSLLHRQQQMSETLAALEPLRKDLETAKAECIELARRHEKEKAELLVAIQSARDQLAQHEERLALKQAEYDELSVKLDHNVVKQAELDALKAALQAEEEKMQGLQAENQSLLHRQQLMNEELIKAEGQINLIKDLLLREQGI